jgi:hypothetical protein
VAVEAAAGTAAAEVAAAEVAAAEASPIKGSSPPCLSAVGSPSSTTRAELAASQKLNRELKRKLANYDTANQRHKVGPTQHDSEDCFQPNAAPPPFLLFEAGAERRHQQALTFAAQQSQTAIQTMTLTHSQSLEQQRMDLEQQRLANAHQTSMLLAQAQQAMAAQSQQANNLLAAILGGKIGK